MKGKHRSLKEIAILLAEAKPVLLKGLIGTQEYVSSKVGLLPHDLRGLVGTGVVKQTIVFIKGNQTNKYTWVNNATVCDINLVKSIKEWIVEDKKKSKKKKQEKFEAEAEKATHILREANNETQLSLKAMQDQSDAITLGFAKEIVEEAPEPKLPPIAIGPSETYGRILDDTYQEIRTTLTLEQIENDPRVWAFMNLFQKSFKN